MAIVHGVKRRLLLLITWLVVAVPSLARRADAGGGAGGPGGGANVLLLKVPLSRSGFAVLGTAPLRLRLHVAGRALPPVVPTPMGYTGPMPGRAAPPQSAQRAGKAIPLIRCTSCSTRTHTQTTSSPKSCAVVPPPPPAVSTPVGILPPPPPVASCTWTQHTRIEQPLGGPVTCVKGVECCVTAAGEPQQPCETVFVSPQTLNATCNGLGNGGGGGGGCATISGCCTSTYPCSPIVEAPVFRAAYTTG